MVESCVHKRFSDRLSSFERSRISLLSFLMLLRRSLLRTDKASFFRNIEQFKDKEFWTHTNLFATVEKVNV